MFYGSCPAACPRLIGVLRGIADGLDAATRADTRVLLVSFDAARDTPAALTALAATHELDGARWRLASLPEEQARELAAVLGVRYRRLTRSAGGHFYHSSVITLLDRAGRIVARVEGLDQEPAPLVDRLVAVASAH
jgi:protein SCO1/2